MAQGVTPFRVPTRAEHCDLVVGALETPSAGVANRRCVSRGVACGSFDRQSRLSLYYANNLRGRVRREGANSRPAVKHNVVLSPRAQCADLVPPLCRGEVQSRR